MRGIKRFKLLTVNCVTGFRSKPSVLLLALAMLVAIVPSRAGDRISEGLLALYDFRLAKDEMVKDHSGSGQPLVRSVKPASKISNAVRRSAAITLEAWVRLGNKKQEGSARIVTISGNNTNRNITLVQEENRYDARFRTTERSNNGLPSLASKPGSLNLKLTHVVFTRNTAGHAKIYLNGKLNSSRSIGGRTARWDPTYRLGLGNVLSKGRPWLGTYHLVAVYGRELGADEVQKNLRPGWMAKVSKWN